MNKVLLLLQSLTINIFLDYYECIKKYYNKKLTISFLLIVNFMNRYSKLFLSIIILFQKVREKINQILVIL